MLQILYLIAFGIIAFLALRNLVSNVLTLGREQHEPKRRRPNVIPHPELVDKNGNLTDEPLLVARSMSLDDARSRLDDLYYQSPDDDED